ncbi:hypothetical protein CPB84DRAFT_1822831 [Gymnopilus junonius]|uniref:CBM1 domain-containing protein n=1 Tax=Gymnopilus junonius TaxID=109634 RepID=A0A9P5NVB2_GYMJU|nr:hypothetical protein CPB84DRAFT_1822831 [Gymnopilus junonius]
MNALSLLGFLSSKIAAQSGAWDQCGGQGWTGVIICAAGYTCTYSNPYYSQCLPGSATVTTGTTTATTKTSTSSTSLSTSSTTSSTTSSAATPTGSQIRSVTDPVYHFYLQISGGLPVLGPESSAGLFTIGSTITLNQASGPKLFLNINSTESTSYQPLTFGTTAITTDWALEGDTLVTTAPRQLNFLACATSSTTIYDLYLQVGNDSPPRQSWTPQTLHLPCLC